MKTREKWKFFREVVLATRALSVSEQVKNVLTTIVKLIGRKFTLVVYSQLFSPTVSKAEKTKD